MSGPDQYFEDEKPYELFSTGSTVLDHALGGGWATNRCLNITGDSSTGKSLVAFESAANFLRTFENSEVIYIDTEAAFNESFQRSLGIPVDRIDIRTDLETVEDVFNLIESLIESNQGSSKNILVQVDSLDALSDKQELDSKITDGKYGASKARVISEIFRRINSTMSKSNITFMTVSQTRENLGFGFSKVSRSGGKSIRFYSSQEVWLKPTTKIKKTINGVENIIGQSIQFKVEKNRIGAPYKSGAIDILFKFGIDDLSGSLEWLKSVKRLDAINMTEKEMKSVINKFRQNKMTTDEYVEIMTAVSSAVGVVWNDIEKSTDISISKY